MKLDEKKKSIEELYKAIFSIRESLQEAVSLAQEAVNISQQFGGEIPRVVTDQLNTYFIPTVAKFIDDEDTPGAMTPLVVFLDSVPLAMTREEPTPEEITPTTAATASAAIATPPETEEPAGPPAEGSYAAQVQESLGRNATGWEKHPSEVDADIDDYEYEWEKHPDELSYEDDDFEDDPYPYAMDTVMDEKKTRKSAAANTVRASVGQTGKLPTGGPVEGSYAAQVQEKVRWRQDFNDETVDANDVKAIERIIGNIKIGFSYLYEAIADTVEMISAGAEQARMVSHLRVRYELSDRDAKAIIRGVNTYIESLPEKPKAKLTKNPQEGKPETAEETKIEEKKLVEEDNTLLIGLGAWDADPNDGELIVDKLRDMFNDASIQYEVEGLEDEDEDYESDSVLPQEEFVNFVVHAPDAQIASQLRKWVRKKYPMALVESAVKEFNDRHEVISYKGFEIVVVPKRIQGKAAYRTSNNIGEPSEYDGKYFKDKEKAISLQKKLIDDYLEETGGSYRKTEAKEKTSDEEVLPTEGLYFVKRKSNGASTLGEIGNIEDQIVATFDSKEEAEPYADYLNTTVPAAEKELFGTEYYVEGPKAFKQDKPDGASKKVKVDESTLNFNDGVSINTDGPLRVTRKSDGYYVVGEGISMPVDDPEEGYEFIKQRRGKVK